MRQVSVPTLHFCLVLNWHNHSYKTDPKEQALKNCYVYYHISKVRVKLGPAAKLVRNCNLAGMSLGCKLTVCRLLYIFYTALKEVLLMKLKCLLFVQMLSFT